MQIVLSGPHRLSVSSAISGAISFLQVKSCGICHSDRKAVSTPPGAMEFPRVLGHEACGILTVDLVQHKLHAGDRVCLWPALACGTCSFCATARAHLCPYIKLFGFHLDGGFASRICIDETDLHKLVCHKIPDSVSFEQATFAEPLGCVIHGLKKGASTISPATILIFGAGVMGRLCSRLARTYWPKAEIILHDKDNMRLKLARHDGSSNSLKPADLVFIAASSRDAFYDGLKHLNPAGTIVLFSGFTGNEKEICMNHNILHQKEQTLVGAYGCLPQDMSEALELMADNTVFVDDMISRVISLPAAIDELQRSLGADDFKTIIREE